MKKILVLGGTGAMGEYLVDILSQNGFHVTVTSRFREDVSESVRFIKGDAHDPIFLKKILTSHNWMAIVDFMLYSTQAFKERRDILLGSTGQYVFLSSSRVYAQSKSPITEESPRLLDICSDEAYLASDEYALSKARQENQLIESSSKNWTIIRPYITFGSERFQLGVFEKEDWLYRAINGRSIVFSKEISERMTTITYGQDVARGIASIIGQVQAFSEAFHIATPVPVRWSEVLETYRAVLDAHKYMYSGISSQVIYADLPSLIKMHPAKYQIIYDRLYDRIFDCRKINQFVDVSQFKDPLPMIKASLEIFLENPKFKPINIKYEAEKDKFTHEITPFYQIPGLKRKIRYFANRVFCN